MHPTRVSLLLVTLLLGAALRPVINSLARH